MADIIINLNDMQFYTHTLWLVVILYIQKRFVTPCKTVIFCSFTNITTIRGRKKIPQYIKLSSFNYGHIVSEYIEFKMNLIVVPDDN